MEGLEMEVTEKIRNAIKKKLTDLGAFVDDELPEYIMVMVANKRSKSQMEEDLSLFLSGKTIEFTNWLHGLLKNLKSIYPGSSNLDNTMAVPVNAKKDITSEAKSLTSSQSSSSPSNSVTSDVEDGDVLALDALDHEADEFLSELPEEKLSQKSEIEADSAYVKQECVGTSKEKSPETYQETYGPERVTIPTICTSYRKKRGERISAKEHFVQQPFANVSRTSNFEPKRAPLSSNVYTAVQNSNDNVREDEYDPMHPSVGSVASVVRLNNKKPTFSLKHPNSMLLLRAMQDANKSVQMKPKVNDIYKPTPIEVLVSANRGSYNRNSFGAQTVKRDNVYEPNIRPFVGGSNVRKSVRVTENVNSDFNMLKNYLSIGASDSDSNDMIEVAPKHNVLTIQECNISADVDEYPVEEEKSVSHILADKTNANESSEPHSPRFVVTLDGFDKKAFKRKLEAVEGIKFESPEVETMDVDYNSDELIVENVEQIEKKKLKTTEKCRFWPACKNGDACPFHHPSIACKSFPNCKFGSKCVYIHPNCKFDALCSRKDCSYTHSSRRDFKHGNIAHNITYSRPTCKFFPNCSSTNCSFFHPKQCRYGSECHISGCTYNHSAIPSRKQLKWHYKNSVMNQKQEE